MKRKLHLIGRGLVSWFAEGLNEDNNCISSMGAANAEEYISDAIPGALVYDASEVDPALYRVHVINRPLLDLRLQPNQFKEFLEWSYQPIQEHSPGSPLPDLHSLDYVGIGLYETLLRAVPGIKIGRVFGDAISWEAR